MKREKKYVMNVVICVILLCVVWGIYFLAMYGIKWHKNRQIAVCEDDFSWVFQVDLAEKEGKVFVLQGFAFEADCDSSEGRFEIVLHDLNTEENFFLETEYTERSDVNEYFLCEYDYLNSGFRATIKSKKIDLVKGKYEVLVRVAGEKTAYQTGTYVSEGKLVYGNPLEYKPLDVKGTDLERIVEEGVLRVYRPDYGIYVYQHEGVLYWIADSYYEFDEYKNVHMQCLIETTQEEKLPNERLESGRYFDSLEFDFLEQEIVDINTGKYRVAARMIPKEYSVEKIQTGVYLSKWVWFQSFRPQYQFH